MSLLKENKEATMKKLWIVGLLLTCLLMVGEVPLVTGQTSAPYSLQVLTIIGTMQSEISQAVRLIVPRGFTEILIQRNKEATH
jgi:hypothetical protein